MKLALILAAFVAVTLAPQPASALTINKTDKIDLTTKEKPKEEPKKVEKPAPKPEPVVRYTVKRGDNLTKIAKRYHTHVKSIWNKNLNLKHPDKLKPGMKLVIPDKDEKTKPRKFPGILKDTAPHSAFKPVGFSSSGNTYTPGQCTWGVKNWRPDIPNTWGNASDWLYNAQAMGWPTGDTPRVGAIGWTSGHVVLIVGVHGGLVDIKDMNGRYIPYEIGYGTYPASKYKYIY